jgi:hypothetical protein
VLKPRELSRDTEAMILAVTPSAAAKITPLALLAARSMAPASNACPRLSDPVNRVASSV